MSTQKSINAIIALFIFALTASAQAHFRKQTDFNGDGKADISLLVWGYDGGTTLKFQIGSTPNYGYRGVDWGSINDTPVGGDFDGDNRADFAVVRAVNNTSVWYILNSQGTAYRSVTFGFASSATETLVPADYDGDGKTDIAVARRNTTNSTITYYWQRSLDGQLGSRTVPFDTNNAQCRASVPGDYNGDGKADIVVRCRNTSSAQYFDITDNAANTRQRIFWGIWTPPNTNVTYFGSGDVFVPGDYDGDGKTDLAVARLSAPDGNQVSNINWYVRMSSTGALMSRQYGGIKNSAGIYFTDAPAPADYDGDGKTDIAIERDTFGGAGDYGTFSYWQNSSDGVNRGLQFGPFGPNPVVHATLSAYASTSCYDSY